MKSWTCAACTYTNERESAFCQICASGRPSVSHAPIDLRSPPSAEGKKADNANTNKKAFSIAASRAEQQQDDNGDTGIETQPAEERRASNPFSSFVYNGDDGEDDTTVSSATVRAFAFMHPPQIAKRPLSKLLSDGCGGGAGEDGAGDEVAPKKKTKRNQHACGEGAPEDFEKESEDTKNATVLKWRRILGPLAKRTGTGNSGIQARGGEGGGEEVKADTGKNVINQTRAKEVGGKEMEAVTPGTDSIADYNPSNLNRFRLLVAVILSSRTQEQIVRRSIQTIEQCYPGRQFSPHFFASSIESWETLSEKLSFVHCNKVKSRHILQTANVIEKEFGGHVPKRKEQLLKMAGIGPTLAPLLEFLFAWLDKEEREDEEDGKEGGRKQETQEGEAQVPQGQRYQQEQQPMSSAFRGHGGDVKLENEDGENIIVG